MNALHEGQTKRLEEDLRNLANRFDRHLEIYAQNGKELAALNVTVKQNHDALDQKIDSMFQFFKDHDADERELHAMFVTDDSFEPIKKIVYAVTSIILTSVVLAVIGLVIIE